MPKDDQQDIVGVVAVSHCELAGEMLRVAELIVGRLDAVRAVGFQPQETLAEMVSHVKEAIQGVDRGLGVLILTDLFGGSPSNICLSMLGPKVEVVCGMNLPMLIKLATCRRGKSVAQIACIVKEYGQRHISLASEVLSRSASAS